MRDCIEMWTDRSLYRGIGLRQYMKFVATVVHNEA